MADLSAPGLVAPAQALNAIAGRIHRTPVMRSESLNRRTGLELVFKCEHLQRTGSFKFRGATFAVSRLAADCPGVATHSSGNHGAALAAAAAARGLSADVVMPENAVSSKIEAVRAYGGTVHFCAPTQAARERGLAELVDAGRVPIPPYDHDHIIAGQGTAAVELLAQDARLDAIIAPIGGGGLLAGIALAAAGLAPGVQVIGAEPSGADDAARSLAAGRRVEDHRPVTIADGLRALVGVRNLAIIADHRVRIETVAEPAIVEAMGLVWQHLKQVIEPSAAVPVAAALQLQKQLTGRRVGIILSGGNIALDRLLPALAPPS